MATKRLERDCGNCSQTIYLAGDEWLHAINDSRLCVPALREATTKTEAPERTIDKMHRETSIPMRALEIAFELCDRGMLDEETMAGLRVIPDTARIIADSLRARNQELRDALKAARQVLAEYESDEALQIQARAIDAALAKEVE